MKILQRTCIILVSLCFLLTFNACEKEPDSKQSKKINSIYEMTEEKDLLATYSWNDELLSQINIANDDWQNVFSYTYNNKQQITEITATERASSSNTTDTLIKTFLEYEGDFIKTIRFNYYDSDIQNEYAIEFTNNGKQITGANAEISISEFLGMVKNEKYHPIRNILQSYIPAQMIEALTNFAQQHANEESKGESLQIEYTWSNNNISKANMIYDIGIATITMELLYEFDNKTTPFSGYILANITELYDSFFGIFHSWMNVNNITKITNTTTSLGNTETEVISYSYEYDTDDYPTKVITTYSPSDTYELLFEYK